MNFSSRALLLALRAYQALLGPLMGGACRYHPSCSEYAAQAIRRWGARRGAWLALRRLARCHPFAPFGYDPVPDPPHESPAALPPAQEARL
jgi:hypothetical protein